MSASLRDRRVRIYGYENSAGQGLVSSRYVFRVERWALVSQVRGMKVVIGAAPNSKVDAIVDFDPAVDVRANDLLVDGDDRYFARGMTLQRQPPARLVGAERISEEVFSSLTVEGDDWAAPTTIDDAEYSASVVES